ncbi:FAD-dependent oxidoreductase family protein [Wolffia australiana]
MRRAMAMARRISHCESAPKETADAVVIGAGVVGIAVARELAIRGRDVLVLESAPTFGTGTSSRNSEVVHAGIYYPLDSFKAKFCVRGRDLLYRYCSERGIPHSKLGKLIVATGTAQIPSLEKLKRRGEENGVEGLKMLDAREAMHMEPELVCVKALLSACSGIVDSHSLMISMLGEAESHKTMVSFNTTIIGGHVEEGKLHLHISETEEIDKSVSASPLRPQLVVIPKLIINAAGLGAVSLAKRFHGLNHRFIPTCYCARGCYFTMSGMKNPFRRLIYPIPEDGGLGVHVTLDLCGSVKFGPDVEWIDSPDETSMLLGRFDYSVDPSRSARFYSEIRKYYPNLKDGSLEPGYAGIRVKLSGPGNPPADFLIQGEETHGLPGLVNLFGIESPGLTSSLAIAEYVASKYSS